MVGPAAMPQGCLRSPRAHRPWRPLSTGLLPLLILLSPSSVWTSLQRFFPGHSQAPLPSPSLASAQPLHLPKPRSARDWATPVHQRRLSHVPALDGRTGLGNDEAEVRSDAALAGAGDDVGGVAAGGIAVPLRLGAPLLPRVTRRVHRDLMSYATFKSKRNLRHKKTKKSKKRRKTKPQPRPSPKLSPSPPPASLSPSPPPPSNIPSRVGSRTLGLSLQGPTVSSPVFHNPWMKYTTVGLIINPSTSGAKPTLNVSSYVDWSPLLSPPADQDQYYYCGACWAFSAAGAVEGAMAARGTSLGQLSAEQLVECSLDDCNGGYSTDAFEYVSGHDLLTNASFPYSGSGTRTCNLPSGAGAQRIKFYETVDLLGPLGLLIAVQNQPVVVQVEADQDSFYNYNGSIYRDTDCFANQYANHEMLLVGYSFNGNLDSTDNYFILKNSWGTSWGINGYMHMAIAPLSPFGMCGIWSGTNSYPVLPALPSEPCKFFPCGAGQCIPRTGQVLPGQSAYTCNCSTLSYLRDANNTDNSPTCVSKYVCALKQGNPCGVGTCLDDNREGGFTCRCPNYFTQGRLASGDITCVPAPYPVLTYTVLVADTCSAICVTLGVSLDNFLALNPALDCNNLVVGSNVSVPAPAVQCKVFFQIDSDTTCDGVLDRFSTAPLYLNSTALLAYNPALNCSALQPGLPICVADAANGNDTWEPVCSKFSMVQPGDTCESIRAANNLTSYDFYCSNQGAQCAQLQVGDRVCVQGGPTKTRTKAGSSSCTSTYTVKTADTCTAIYSKYYSSSAVKFQACNKATCTSSYLFTGRVLCIC